MCYLETFALRRGIFWPHSHVTELQVHLAEWTAPPCPSQTNQAFLGALGLGHTQERTGKCGLFLK